MGCRRALLGPRRSRSEGGAALHARSLLARLGVTMVAVHCRSRDGHRGHRTNLDVRTGVHWDQSPVIVVVAPTGAEVTRAQQPALPHTPGEIAAEVHRAVTAGASVVH